MTILDKYLKIILLYLVLIKSFFNLFRRIFNLIYYVIWSFHITFVVYYFIVWILKYTYAVIEEHSINYIMLRSSVLKSIGIRFSTYNRIKKRYYNAELYRRKLLIIMGWELPPDPVQRPFTEETSNLEIISDAIKAMTLACLVFTFYKIMFPTSRDKGNVTKIDINTEGLVVQKSLSDNEIDKKISEVEINSSTTFPVKANPISGDMFWQKKPPVTLTQEQKLPCQQILLSINKNIRKMRVIGQYNNVSYLTGVVGSHALINKHVLGEPQEDIWRIEILESDFNNAASCVITINKDAVCQVTGDIYLVDLRVIQFRNILPYIIREELPTIPVYGVSGHFNGTDVTVEKMAGFDTLDKGRVLIPILKPLAYSTDHARGLCGLPLSFNHGQGYVFGGIHIAGSNHCDKAFSEGIWYDAVIKARQKLLRREKVQIFSQGNINLDEEYPHIEGLHRRSPFRFENSDGIEVCGTIAGKPMQKLGKSKIKETEFLDVVDSVLEISPLDEFGNPKFCPPVFGYKTDANGERLYPYNIWIRKASKVKKSLDPNIMDRVEDFLSNLLISRLRNYGVTHLNPIPLSVAVNGYPQNFYYRSMDASTSGGFGFSGPKKVHSEYVPLSFKTDSFIPLYTVKKSVVDQLTQYEKSECGHPVIGCQLKDEPRSYNKVQKAKTRVFGMSSYPSTIVQRMYLAPIYTKIFQYRDVFSAAIGINMHSSEADKFYTDLVSFSDRMMEGDYGGYDTSMPIDVAIMVNNIIYRIAKEFGYSEYALQQLMGVLNDNTFPTMCMRGDIFIIPGFQPSGKYGTAEDNSLRGLVLLVYAYAIMCCPEGSKYSINITTNFTLESFFDYIKPGLYGDDMLAAIKPEISDVFNNVTYQKFCECIGMEFTNAQKTSDMKRWLKPEQVSFLKRTFVWDDILNRYIAPLDKDSIMKSICYCLPSKSVTYSEQMVDAVISALREWYFHERDSSKYNALRLKFANLCAKFYRKDESTILKVFPSFEELTEQLKEN